jgi:hypothetical protein
MGQFRRVFTVQEAEEVKQFIKYGRYRLNKKAMHTFYELMKSGWVNRTPALKDLQKGFKQEHPGKVLPSCLRL